MGKAEALTLIAGYIVVLVMLFVHLWPLSGLALALFFSHEVIAIVRLKNTDWRQ